MSGKANGFSELFGSMFVGIAFGSDGSLVGCTSSVAFVGSAEFWRGGWMKRTRIRFWALSFVESRFRVSFSTSKTLK